MKVIVIHDPQKFVEHAGGFLASHPIEHNVLATVVTTLEPSDGATAPLFAWVEAGESGEVSAAALRTPPRRLLASTMNEEAADALMGKVLDVDPELPGVNGPQPAASYLAESWRRRTGCAVERGMSQGVYWLARVNEPPQRPGGRFRPAAPADRDLLVGWTLAFGREAGVDSAGADLIVDRRLGDGRLFVWDDQGVDSMVGTHPPVEGIVRLGPVYTPPARRRRGYATALVAEVSRRALATEATACMLYADLANPASNSVYESVGYRRSTEAQEYLFRC